MFNLGACFGPPFLLFIRHFERTVSGISFVFAFFLFFSLFSLFFLGVPFALHERIPILLAETRDDVQFDSRYTRVRSLYSMYKFLIIAT